MRERLVLLGAEVAPSSAADFAAFPQREHARWSKMLKDLDIRPAQ